MNYKTAGAFRDALEKRLRDHSEESGIPIVCLRKSVVFDRLLARLIIVEMETSMELGHRFLFLGEGRNRHAETARMSAISSSLFNWIQFTFQV